MFDIVTETVQKMIKKICVLKSSDQNLTEFKNKLWDQILLWNRSHSITLNTLFFF